MFCYHQQYLMTQPLSFSKRRNPTSARADDDGDWRGMQAGMCLGKHLISGE